MIYCFRKVIVLTVGERIRMLREERDMTLEDVARRLGVSRATVFKYERGDIAKIPPNRIEALAELFGVSKSYIMGWTTDKQEEEPMGRIGIAVPDGDKFIRAYSVMSYQDRVTLTEIFKRAYEKMEEQEKNG